MIGRSTKVFLEVVVSLVLIAGVACAIAAWRLSQGPISLGFLTPVVESAVNAGSARRIDIEDTVLAWRGLERSLDVRAVGVSVYGPDGRRIARLPEIAFSLSPRALLRGLIAPTRLEVPGAVITLTRAPDGSFGFAAGESPDDTSSALPLLLAELLHPPDPDRSMGYLQQVRITDGEVTLFDQGTGYVWRAPQAEIVMSRDEVGIRADATLVVDLAGELTRVAASALYLESERQIDVSASTTAFQPATLAAIDPRLAALEALRIPVSGSTQFRMDPSGRLLALDFDIAGSAGTLNHPAHFPGEVPIQRLRIRGSAGAGLDRIEVAEALVDLGGPTIEFAGSLSGWSTQPRVSVEGAVRNLPTDDLRRFWPLGVAKNARRWITANLSGGVIEETRFSAELAAPDASLTGMEPQSVSAHLRFSGVDVNYLSPMPPVRGVSGTGKLDATRLDLAITGGGIDKLRVSDSTIAITGLDQKDQYAEIELIVRGPVHDVLQLVDSPPLGYVKAIGLAPDEFGGNSATRLRLRIPLISELKFDQIQIAAAANVADFSQRGAVLGRDVTDGRLMVRLDRRGMDITGTITAVGVPAEVKMTRSFLADVPVVAQTKLKATVDTAARRALGLDFGRYVDGPVQADVSLTEQRDRRSDLALELVLTDAALDVPELEWRKEPGTAGTAHLRMTLRNEKLAEIGSIRVAAGDLVAQGRAVFEADGKTLGQVEIERLKAGLTDARGSYARTAQGLEIRVIGRSLNVGPMLRDRTPAESGRPPLTISAELDRLYLAPDRFMERVRVEGRRGVEGWVAFDLQAKAGGEGTARNLGVSLREEGDGQRLDAAAEDAGAVLRALGITPNVVGGRLELTGATQPDSDSRPLAGKLKIRDFRVVNAPLLARVLGVALLTGIGDALRGNGITFSILESDFVFTDPKIEVKDARASGASLGITANGVVDIAAETIDLSGTLVPAYAVNSLLGRIPVIGDVLVGGPGGGVFAANYKLEGPINDAKVSINPLSTIAPGFLRNLFGLGGTSPTGTDPRPDPGAGREAQPQ